VVGTLISRALVTDHPSYLIPHYQLLTPVELLRALFIGPILGVASALYIRVIDGVAMAADRLPRRLAPFLPVAALAALGVSALWLPQVLGNGYDTVNAALLSELSLLLLVLLPLAKLLATAVCAGAGVPGGLFTPSLYYGALLGGAYGVLTQRLGGTAPPGAFALLGMGAMLAGSTHAPVSAVLIIFELTGDYALILPLMLGCVVAAGVSRRLMPDSLYTVVLRRRHVQLPEMPRPHWLRARRVRDVPITAAERVAPDAPVRQVVLKLLGLPAGHDLYVVADDGRLLGVIDLDALAHIPVQARARLATAAEVMDAAVQPVRIDQTLSEAAAASAQTDLERLPVVTEDRRLVGTIAKRDMLRVGQF
jgi:CIC family chloride channel protein